MRYVLLLIFIVIHVIYHESFHIKDVILKHNNYQNHLLQLISVFYCLIIKINFLNMKFMEIDMEEHQKQTVATFKSNIFYNQIMIQLLKLKLANFPLEINYFATKIKIFK